MIFDASDEARGFRWMLGAYLTAMVAACFTLGLGLSTDLLWQSGYADLAATLVIFGFSFGLNNSSLYDPYWSVVPMVLVLYWALQSGVGVGLAQGVMVALIWIWGARLTWNFWRGWPGLHHEDWRYVAFRDKTGSLYWLVSFSGIHLFPTVMVFFGLLGPYVFSTADGVQSWLCFGAAVLVTTGAIVIEAVADEQLRVFVSGKPEPGSIMRSGLWAYSRHPNYFGEMSFWWGLWLFGMAADPSAWWTIIGPGSITAMFVFASIPMLDERSVERRPAYAEHMQRVSGLVPLPPRREG